MLHIYFKWSKIITLKKNKQKVRKCSIQNKRKKVEFWDSVELISWVWPRAPGCCILLLCSPWWSWCQCSCGESGLRGGTGSASHWRTDLSLCCSKERNNGQGKSQRTKLSEKNEASDKKRTLSRKQKVSFTVGDYFWISQMATWYVWFLCYLSRELGNSAVRVCYHGPH